MCWVELHPHRSGAEAGQQGPGEEVSLGPHFVFLPALAWSHLSCASTFSERADSCRLFLPLGDVLKDVWVPLLKIGEQRGALDEPVSPSFIADNPLLAAQSRQMR